MRRLSAIALPLAVFLVVMLAAVMGAKVFGAWGQVTVLWAAEVNPLELVGHPHMPRYLVAYPGFLMEASLPGVGFSLFIGLFIGLNVLLLRLISQLGAARRPSLGVYTLFICAQFVMNGRGAIAWTGWLLCVWVCLKLAAGISSPGSQIGWISLSCLLAAVSTGVFVVVVVAFVMFLAARLRPTSRSNRFRSIINLALVLPLIYATSDTFILAITKNFEFYGGDFEGFINIFQHGLGAFLLLRGPLDFLLLSITLLVVGAFIALALYGRSYTPLERLIGLSFACGFFGFTVLTLAIPPLLVRTLAIAKPGHTCLRPRLRG